MRGIVARTHTNNVAKNIVFITRIGVFSHGIVSAPQNSADDTILIIKMLVYSAIKIMANSPLLYSVLNPETSSDSPSAKSNGVRLVSASAVINHMTISGINISIIHEY